MMEDIHRDNAVLKNRGDDFSRLAFTLGPDEYPVAAGDGAFSEVTPETADSARPNQGGGEDGTRENPQVEIAEDAAQTVAHPLVEEGDSDAEPGAEPRLLRKPSAIKRLAARHRQPPIWGWVRRKQVSLFYGPPGAGKSQFVLQAGVAMAAGKPFAGHTPVRPCKVVFFSPEDEADVISDRIEAAAKVLDADMALVEENLVIAYYGESGVLFEPGVDGVRLTTLGSDFFAEVAEFGADAICLDPMAELHRLAEADNGAMNGLMARLRTFARKGNYAVLMTHHTAKPESGDKAPTLHSGRGASATGAASRHVEILSELTKAERDRYGITDERLPDFIRREVSKDSYGRKPGVPMFLKRVEVEVNGAAAPALVPVELVAVPADSAKAEPTRKKRA
ncbi:MAG: AAA family ATPase [Opitutaceae bacterium]|nr:AAA family ATPase [Opitutaceae bacterium]